MEYFKACRILSSNTPDGIFLPGAHTAIKQTCPRPLPGLPGATLSQVLAQRGPPTPCPLLPPLPEVHGDCWGFAFFVNIPAGTPIALPNLRLDVVHQ